MNKNPKGELRKSDGAKQLHAYVQSVRKRGGNLLMSGIPSTSKDARRRRAAAVKAELKKDSN